MVTFRPLTNKDSEVRLPPVTPAVIKTSSRDFKTSRGTSSTAIGDSEFDGEDSFQRPPLRESPKSADGNPFPNFRVQTSPENNFNEIPQTSERRVSEDLSSELPQGAERQRLLEAALAAEEREKKEREEEMRKLKEAGAARRRKLFDKERRRLSDVNNRRRKLARDRNRDDERRSRDREQGRSRQEDRVSESQAKVVEEATKAVLQKEEAGNVRSSPIVWAAVMTLSEFLAAQETSSELVPTDVLQAIQRLTLFIRDEAPVKEEEELKSMQAITKFTQRRQHEVDTRVKQLTRPTSRTTSRPTTRSTTRTTSRTSTRSTRRPTTSSFRRPTTTRSLRLNPSPAPTRQTQKETTTKSAIVPPRRSFSPTRKPAVKKEEFTRPPPPAYLKERPTLPEDRGGQQTEEEDRNFYAQKYLESDLIRRNNKAEEEEVLDYPEYAADYADYSDYSPPSVRFKFKFNTATGVFSANTDLQPKIAEAPGRSSKPPSAPPQNNRFKIYTLPT